MDNINHVRDLVSSIDVSKKKILLKSKQSLVYDFLILSPGISFKWNNLLELKDDKSIIRDNNIDLEKTMNRQESILSY